MSNGVNFGLMSCNCSELTSLQPLSSYDTKNGEYFGWMFYNTPVKDARVLSKWNVEKGQSFKAMFGKNGMDAEMLPQNLKEKSETLSDKDWFE